MILKWHKFSPRGILILTGFLLLAFSLFFSKQVQSEETLSIYLIDDYPPYSWLENGEERGIDVEILRELDQRLDIKLDLHYAPWKRILSGLKEGTVEAAIQTWWRKDRTAFLEYMSVPLRTTTISIIGRKETTVSINELSDFNNLRVGKIRAFSISTAFDEAARKNQFDLIEVDHLEQAFKMLEQKRLDILVHSTSSTEFRKRTHPDDLHFKLIRLMREEREGTFLVLSKRHFRSDATAMINKLDAAVSEMHNDGTIARIFENFLD